MLGFVQYISKDLSTFCHCLLLLHLARNCPYRHTRCYTLNSWRSYKLPFLYIGARSPAPCYIHPSAMRFRRGIVHTLDYIFSSRSGQDSTSRFYTFDSISSYFIFHSTAPLYYLISARHGGKAQAGRKENISSTSSYTHKTSPRSRGSTILCCVARIPHIVLGFYCFDMLNSLLLSVVVFFSLLVTDRAFFPGTMEELFRGWAHALETDFGQRDRIYKGRAKEGGENIPLLLFSYSFLVASRLGSCVRLVSRREAPMYRTVCSLSGSTC
jgi:hypothetical protein